LCGVNVPIAEELRRRNASNSAFRASVAICEHLEAVTAGKINRLLINVPPGNRPTGE
jgi:hypothetical protein